MYPSLIVIHLPGRALWFCNILSRQHDHVTVERSDTAISRTLEGAINELTIPDLTDQIKIFHQMKCKQARNVVAAYILDLALKYCINSSELQLSDASLLIFQYHFDDTDIQI